jgi:small-conductance mechanosensitive channel
METLIPKIIYTAISLIVVLVSRNVVISLIKRYARTHEKVQQRTNLVIKYFDFTFVFIFIFWNILVWGVDFSDVGLVFSSVFAVIGVAMFAQWSILSNITSGIIMFFTFPYKIGDKIKIHDKDFYTEPLIIDDILTFQTILRSEKGELLSYPNNLILQKGITMISASHLTEIDHLNEEKNLTQTHD